MPQLQDKERVNLHGPRFIRLLQKYANEKLDNYEGTQFNQENNPPPPQSANEDDYGLNDASDDDYNNWEVAEEEDLGETSKFFGAGGPSQRFGGKGMSSVFKCY